MGLLDDAIREHLELKRRRGGDPQEIARAEQEALRPLDFNLVPAWAAQPAELEAHLAPAAAQQQIPQAPFDGAEMLQAGAHDEQATVEVDMAAVIGQDDDGHEDARPVAAEHPLPHPERSTPGHAEGPIRARRLSQGLADQLAEDFEWETPEPPATGADEQRESAWQGSFAFE